MRMQKFGAVIGVIGAVYLVVVAWTSSWWYVPALLQFGSQASIEGTPIGGTTFFILWGTSGVLGAMIVMLGTAMYGKIGPLRLLLFTAGSIVLLLWLVLWTASSHHGCIFGAGGGLILLFFLMSCLDWAKARRHLEGRARTAADLRLGANLNFFIAAWGMCGLLGAPISLLRPEMRGAAGGGETLAVKVLVCLVLGWGLTAVAQRLERQNYNTNKPAPCGE